MKQKITVGLVVLALCICGFLTLFPIYWMFVTSLQSGSAVLREGPRYLFFSPTFSNYSDLLQGGFLKAYLNSVIVAIGHTFLATALALPAAYAFACTKVRGKRFIQFWIVVTRSLPPIGVALPFYLIYIRMGISGTRFSLMILYLTLNLSFAVMMLRGFIEELPFELIEVAKIDGANTFQILAKVVIPLITPGLVASSVFVFTVAWNEYIFAFLFTSSQSVTAPVRIASFITPMGIQWGPLSAAGILIIAPVIIFSIVIRKYLIAGLTMGAVK